MNKFIITLLSTATIFTACQKAVNITIPYDGDKLVLKSFIGSDSLIYADITKSAQTSAGLNVLPDSVKVELWENNVFKEVMKSLNIGFTSKIIFTSRSIANTSARYSIRVSAKNLRSIEGSDVFAAKPQFRISNYKQISGTSNESTLRVEIDDAGNQENFYLIRLFNADSIQTPTGPKVVAERPVPLNFDVDNLGEAVGITGSDNETYFVLDDSKFNGKTIPFTLRFFDSYSNFPNNGTFAAVMVSGIGKDTYRYFKSLKAAQNANGNPFAEVVNIFSNVKGGFGIVGCLNDNIATIKRSN